MRGTRRLGDRPGVEHQRRWQIRVRENSYRDWWLLAITLIALLGIWLNHGTLTAQVKGRHFAVGAICATLSSISEAGRQVIVSGAEAPDTPFMRFLEAHGYPSRAERQRHAQAAARLYVQRISTSVQQEVGGKAAHLVRPDGGIDCAELQKLSNAVVNR